MTVHEQLPRASNAEVERRRLMAMLLARQTAPAVLAPNQERLFVLQQLEPLSTAYIESVVMQLSGPLEQHSLVEVLRALPERHEWLRSRIKMGLDGPLQVVDGPVLAPIDVVDLSEVTGVDTDQDHDHQTRTWLEGLVNRPFRLEAAPPWRAGLATLGPEEHLLVLVVHHVACDATSLGTLVDEIGDRYDAAVEQEAYEAERPPSARDLARIVRALQSSPAGQAATARHVAVLAETDLDVHWSTGDGEMHQMKKSLTVGKVVRPVPASVTRRLRRLAAERGLTPFSLLSAAVLAGLADCQQVASPVLGIPVDLRAHLPGSEECVAFLVETVIVAVPAVRQQSLLEAATTVRDTLTDGLAQPPRFEDVVTALRARGALSPTGVPAHAYLTWLDGRETTTLGDHGPLLTYVDLPLVTAKSDLAFSAVERGEAVELRLEYDYARLDRCEVDKLLDAILSTLSSGTSDPTTPLGALPLPLPGSELLQLNAFEGEAAAEPVIDLLEHVLAGLAPLDTPVLITDGDIITARELRGLVDQLAKALLAAGVGDGTRVAVSAHRVPAMVVSVLAVLRAGATYLPLDPAHPPARQRQLARLARTGAVLGLPAWGTALAADLGVPFVGTDPTGHPVGPTLTSQQPWPIRGPRALAYVMFTSGSTGTPKAVRVHDASIVARVDSFRRDHAEAGVRFLLQSSLTFDASTYQFWALATGGSLVLPTDSQASDPAALAAITERHQVTDVFYIPGLYEAVLGFSTSTQPRSLARVHVGGDVLPPALAALHHEVLPGVMLMNAYGPTETVVTAVTTSVSVEDASRAIVPIGRPHPGTAARVVDRFGRRVRLGAVGELHLGGPAVADGYDDPVTGMRVPAERGNAFYTPDNADGTVQSWYATGDRVRWLGDGRLEYLGRSDRQVKRRGQRVELDEIEQELKRLSGVDEAAVDMVGEEPLRRLAAVVAPERAVHGARNALAGVLPQAWLPDVILALPALPRTASGKIDRAACREAARVAVSEAHRCPVETHQGRVVGGPSAGEERTSDVSLSEQSSSVGSTLERSVLSVVRGLLGNDALGLDDDFFAVGGNSLLAARLVGQLHTVLGVAVPLHALVGRSTMRGIAALAQHEVGRAAMAPRDECRLLPVRPSGTLPPVVLVARSGALSLLLLHVIIQLEPQRPVWTLLRSADDVSLRVPDLIEDGRTAASVIRSQFEQGPVHLVGHSASGLVALEAARTLGDRCGQTILLDTIPPTTWAHPLRRGVEAGKLMRWGRRMRRRLLALDTVPPTADDVRLFRSYQDTAAVHRAKLSRAAARVTLFTSPEAREAQGRGDLGWSRWVRDVTTVSLDGDHHQMVLQPDVRHTAELLVRVLRS